MMVLLYVLMVIIKIIYNQYILIMESKYSSVEVENIIRAYVNRKNRDDSIDDFIRDYNNFKYTSRGISYLERQIRGDKIFNKSDLLGYIKPLTMPNSNLTRYKTSHKNITIQDPEKEIPKPIIKRVPKPKKESKSSDVREYLGKEETISEDEDEESYDEGYENEYKISNPESEAKDKPESKAKSEVKSGVGRGKGRARGRGKVN